METLKFDNFYLGDMNYKHYTYFTDFDFFHNDNIIFGLFSEDNNEDYDNLIDLVSKMNNTITFYDCLKK